jgi:WD40 repeat protein
MLNRPYVGMRPYKREESDIFFGRDGFIENLTGKLEEQRVAKQKFIAISGNSGCGKSSLIRAGLLANLAIGVVGNNEWRVAYAHPNDDPFTNVAKALLEKVSDPNNQEQTLREDYLKHFGDVYEQELAEKLQQSSDSLKKIINDNILPQNYRLLLVIDQFEEIFTYTSDQKLRESFIEWLLDSSKHQKIHIVIGLRSEFIDSHCDQYPNLIAAINNGYFSVPCFLPENLNEIIEIPASYLGVTVNKDLTERLVKDAKKLQAELGNPQISLIQYALSRIWDNYELRADDANRVLTVQDYEQIGGIKAFNLDIQKIYNGLNQQEQHIAEVAFRRLIRCKNEKDCTRHPVTIGELVKLADVGVFTAIDVIKKFHEPPLCILTFPHKGKIESEQSIIDISHESIVHHWQLLKEWAISERNLVGFFGYVEKTAKRWKDNEGGLWEDLSLKNAKTWQAKLEQVYKSESARQAWASHHGINLNLVYEFFEASKQHEQDLMEEREQALREKERRKNELKEQKDKLRKAREKFFLVGTFAYIVLAFLAISSFFWYQAEQARKEIKSLEAQRTIDLYKSIRQYSLFATQKQLYMDAKEKLAETHAIDKFVRYPPAKNSRNLIASLIDMSYFPAQHSYGYPNVDVMLYTLAYNPEKQLLAVAGEEGKIFLFDTNKGFLDKTLEKHKNLVTSLVFTKDKLISADDDGKIIFWSLEGELLQEEKMQASIKTLAYSSHLNILASAGTDSNINLWNLQTNTNEQIATEHGNTIRSLAFSHDSQFIASASFDKTAKIWELGTKTLTHELKGHTDALYDVSFSPDDTMLATSSADGTIRLWSVATGDSYGNPLKDHKGTVFSSQFIENGKRLVSASEDKDLRIWDIESGKTLLFLQAHTNSVVDIVVHEDAIFSVSSDMTAKQWSSKLPYQIHEMLNIPTATAIVAEQKQLIVGYENGLLQLFSLPEMELITETAAHQDLIQRLAISQNGQWAASASWHQDKQVRVWQLEPRKLIAQSVVIQHQKGIHSIAFSPDNRFLVSGGMDGQIGILDLQTQKVNYHTIDAQNVIVSVSFDNTGKLLTSTANQVNLWDFNILRTSANLPEPLHKSTQLLVTRWAALSDAWGLWRNKDQQKQRYVTTGRDSTIKVFEIDANKPDTAKLQYELVGHRTTVWKTIFSPDNQQLATASADGTIRFWDLLNGSGPFTLQLPIDHRNALYDFDFQCDKTGYCWVAVPLMNAKLIIYDLGKIYIY